MYCWCGHTQHVIAQQYTVMAMAQVRRDPGPIPLQRHMRSRAPSSDFPVRAPFLNAPGALPARAPPGCRAACPPSTPKQYQHSIHGLLPIQGKSLPFLWSPSRLLPACRKASQWLLAKLYLCMCAYATSLPLTVLVQPNDQVLLTGLTCTVHFPKYILLG